MKAIMVMFDSLNRHMLQPYGGELGANSQFPAPVRAKRDF